MCSKFESNLGTQVQPSFTPTVILQGQSILERPKIIPYHQFVTSRFFELESDSLNSSSKNTRV